jgi:hypothetical protein
MSWFQMSIKAVDARNQASAAEIVECFRDERCLLTKLAFLITEDQASADRSVDNACAMTLHGNSPFRDWLLEWAKAATITTAISQKLPALRNCEAEYEHKSCNHAEHSWQCDAGEREASLNLIVNADPRKLIAELDPLCRAILVLKLAIRSSIQDCVLRLNVSRAAVLAANCQAMAWLHELQLKGMEAYPNASCALQESLQGS